MQLPKVVEVRGIRVLTSAQIAACYNTSRDRIKQNFRENKSRYVEGKHYIELIGNELRKFKNEVGNSYPVNESNKNEVRNSHPAEIKARYQFETEFKYAKSLYLWTEKGALLHAKSLNTDKAWEVYDYLVDFYFRAKEEQKVPVTVETKTIPVVQSKSNIREVVDVPENPEILNAIKKIRDDLICMDVLLQYSIRYTEKEEYYKTQKAAAEVLPIIVQDWNKLFDTKPKIVQKQY